jgi:LuxR family maltose regulon positive regulatory protein
VPNSVRWVAVRKKGYHSPDQIFYNVQVTATLLQTKLFVPPTRLDYVPRTRLIHHLDEGLSRRRALTLISAPAGYGKTTIVVEWLRERQLPVAWLSVDNSDNEPARFFAYLFAAMGNIDQDFAEKLNQLLQAAPLPSPVALMTSLINDITTYTSGEKELPGDPVFLVLDDYQAITETTIHESVDFLLERFPPGMHLVIVTRQDPPLALSRLRGRDLITELRQNDLRFTFEESAQFLADYMDPAPSKAEIEALNDRAEGWVAGIQLAALSMQGLDQSQRERFIEGFSGRHRFILDYLTHEVMNRQEESVQSFLLHTSILDQLCGDLCEAVVTGQEAWTEREPDTRSQELLEHLKTANLFLIPLDDDRHWYRYHQLFAELLRARLQESDPRIVPELHHRAAVWYEENGFIAQAVHHELLSDDTGRAADLIGRAIMNFESWSKVEVVTFLGWLQALPEAVLGARPWLRLFKSRSLYVTGETQQARRNLELLETWIEGHPTAPDIERLRGVVSADQASYSVVRGDLRDGISYAQRTLMNLPEEDGPGRMRAEAILGLAYYRLGDVALAEEAFSEAIDTAIGMDLAFGVVPLICNVAEIQIIQGKLYQALKSCGEARWLEIAVRPGDESGAFTLLNPLQPLTPAPYALFASGAEWASLSGIPAGFDDGVDDDTTYTPGQGLVLTSTTFSLAATYQLPQTCVGGQVAKWTGSAWTCADDDVGAGGGAISRP